MGIIKLLQDSATEGQEFHFHDLRDDFFIVLLPRIEERFLGFKFYFFGTWPAVE
jgi:hypothetical protein